MTTLKTLLASAALVVSAAGANAATYFADTVISADRGFGCTGSVSECSANKRLNAGNAVDGKTKTFYSLGFGGMIDLGFSNLKTASSNTITAFEVTFQPQGNHREAADVFTLLNGVASYVGRIFNDTGTGSVNPGSVMTTRSFDSIRLVDVTRVVYGDDTDSFDGFDVAQVSVAAVPLPAAGLMLLGGLGGLAALRRRKKAA